MNKDYRIKKNYYLLCGLYESVRDNGHYIEKRIIDQYNDILGDLEILLNDDLGSFVIGEEEKYNEHKYLASTLLYQILPIIKFLENMHINSSDYQISKVGYLYNSIEDKDLHDRCGDILLGETAFDRAINQATQILEDRIKKKANLTNTTLIGIPLVSKAIHAKLDNTILKFSDNADIQEGYSNLFKGIVSIYRNPTHHTIGFKCDREYALKFCAYVDELLKQIDKAEVIM